MEDILLQNSLGDAQADSVVQDVIRVYFERHFLALYKTYLLEQLHSTDQPSLEHACWVQKLLPLDDKEVVGLLKNSSVQLKASPPF